MSQFTKNLPVYGDPKVGCFFALQNRGLIVRVTVLVSLLQLRLHSVTLFVPFNIHITMLYLLCNDLVKIMKRTFYLRQTDNI